MIVRIGRILAVAVIVVLTGAAPAFAPSHPQRAPRCGGFHPTIIGTQGPDRLDGTPERDVIAGRGGADTILGLEGHDVLCGGADADEIRGGAGADVVWGGRGEDFLAGGDGHDDLLGGRRLDLLEGGKGDDGLFPGLGGAKAIGEVGSDLFVPESGVSLMHGMNGRDVLSFLFSDQPVRLDLGEGAGSAEGPVVLEEIDEVVGSRFSDRLIGGPGPESLMAGGGVDVVRGRGGSDRLEGGSGSDRLQGGVGQDWAIFESSAHGVRANLAEGFAVGDGRDVLVDVENLSGSRLDDVLLGTEQRNLLFSGDGADRLFGRAGDDHLWSGDLGHPGAAGDRNRGGPGSDDCEPDGDSTCESISHGDPAYILFIGRPRPGYVHVREDVLRLGGEAQGFLLGLNSVQLAIRRLTPNGCWWWRPAASEMVRGPCNAPLRFEARYRPNEDRWFYRVPGEALPSGQYTAQLSGNREEWISDEVNFAVAPRAARLSG